MEHNIVIIMMKCMLDTLNIILKLEQRRKALKLCLMHKLVGTETPKAVYHVAFFARLVNYILATQL